MPVVSKHGKQCSTSLVIKEIQIKIMRCRIYQPLIIYFAISNWFPVLVRTGEMAAALHCTVLTVDNLEVIKSLMAHTL